MDEEAFNKITETLKVLRPKTSVVELALELVVAEKPQLLLDQLSEAYVVLPEKLINAIPVKSSYFTRWVRGLYFEKFGKGLSGENANMIVATVEAQVFTQGYSEVLYNRWAFVNEELYFDMGDWQTTIHITKNEWKPSKNPPVHFRKFAHHKLQILPASSNEGDLKRLLKYVNLESESDKLLLLAHLPALCFPDDPRAVLVPSGPPGAAKTTLLRLILSLVDPSVTDVFKLQTDIKEISQLAYKHYCLFFDNISYLSVDLSDQLCTLVTGLSFSKRQLYTDDSDIIWLIRNALGLSGIGVVPSRSDLLSRSLILLLEAIPEKQRRPEAEFWSSFERDKPYILAGIFNCLVKVLAQEDLEIDNLPRMADYAKRAALAATTLGYSVDEYLDAYRGNIEKQNEATIESSPTAQAIIMFMENKQNWEGSSSTLYSELKVLVDKSNLAIGGEEGFPKASSWLWRKIVPIRGNLLSVGISVSKDRTSGSKQIILSKVPENVGTVGTTGTNFEENQAQNASMSAVPAYLPPLDGSIIELSKSPESNDIVTTNAPKNEEIKDQSKTPDGPFMKAWKERNGVAENKSVQTEASYTEEAKQ